LTKPPNPLFSAGYGETRTVYTLSNADNRAT
jgi:hypothetical protein